MAKPKSNQRMKLVDSVESIVQNPTLKDIVVAVEDKSKKTETLGNTPTPDEEGKSTYLSKIMLIFFSFLKYLFYKKLET